MSVEEAGLILKQVREALVQSEATALEQAEARLQSVREGCPPSLLLKVHRDLMLTWRVASQTGGRLQSEVSRLSVAQFGYAPGGAAGMVTTDPAGGTCG